MKPLLLTLIFLVVLSGCSYQRSKLPEEDPSALSGEIQAGAVGYAGIRTQVLGKCVSCHGSAGGNAGGVNLESLDSIRKQLKRIEVRAIQERTMPPGQPLSGAERNMLAAWIRERAPENAPGSTPESAYDQTGPAFETVPTWTFIQTKIFEPRCIECHSQPSPVAGLDLRSLEVVRAKAGSILAHVIADKDMPPAAPLPKSEAKQLSNWIVEGMPE